MKGPDVRAFQRLLNHRFAAWGINKRIAERLRGRPRPRGAGVPHVRVARLRRDRHGVEPSFRNVFGHDTVRNPIKSPPGGVRVVTEESYRARRPAHQVAIALGLTASAYEHGVTPRLRMLIRTPSKRSAPDRRRAKTRRGYRAKLRKRYTHRRPGRSRRPAAQARRRSSTRSSSRSPGATRST